MIIDIFIRTYSKDFDILNVCLYSIKKYLTGFRNIIICVREKEYNLLTKVVNLQGCKVIKTFNYDDSVDYLGQQISKLHAHTYTDAEYIYFIDSDCILSDYMNIENVYFDKENKLIILKDYWKNVGDANLWQPCLQYLGLLTEYEFMRRLPQLYPSNIFTPIKMLIQNKTGCKWHEGCHKIYSNAKFSEFNIMGSYIYLYANQNINFKFSSEETILPFKQHWSLDYHTSRIGISNKLTKINELKNSI